jgi:uncharacterized membrane protein YjgN (DUF898 family)
MKNEPDNQKFPWWAIPLIALASFRFEYHSENGSTFSYDGTTTAVLVIGIISLVMVFGITKAVQRTLKAHGLIDRLPRSRFWVLLPFSIIVPGIGYRAISDTGFSSKFTDEYVFHWDFRWGAHPWHLWLIFGILSIIFLHTAKLTLDEIERSAKKS